MMIRQLESVYILVIDDDPAVREFLADQLINRGYKVMTTDNGPEAIECIKNSKFHVVITDFRMPGMNGIETLEEIKKSDPSAQVIMVSGHADVETVVEAVKKGAYHFLQKPIAMSKLFSLIEEVLQKKELKLESVLEAALGRVESLFHADESSFMLMDKDDHLYIACSRGLSEEVLYTTTLAIGERVAGLAAEKGQEYLIVGDLDKYPEFNGIRKHPRIRSSIVLPVYYQQKLLGVLSMSRSEYPKDFTSNDLHDASLFAEQIAQAVHGAKCYEDAEMDRCDQVIKGFLETSPENDAR